MSRQHTTRLRPLKPALRSTRDRDGSGRGDGSGHGDDRGSRHGSGSNG